ncbi:protease modulator HflK [Luteolibacter ambystomatis]|uniref:Protease modulator HflK n=1 Tax=Luteolibacter ambystomatis TaxID=2824561 RepID=A0A975IY98_9BACT|nr:protease modulator HflK [Luteolibacter ambystomatis]QUE50012.1 protease modulator HflK [Luteolibacter ambystomatis]
MKKHELRSEGRAVEALLILLKHLTAHARWVFVALLAFYALSGIRTIQPQEQALVLRFGRLQPQVHGPGLLVGLPDPFDKVLRFETGKDLGLSLDRWATTGMKLDDPNKVVVPDAATLEREVQESGNRRGKSIEDKQVIGNSLDPLSSGYTLTADTNVIQGRFLLRYRIEDPFRFASAGSNIEDLLGCMAYRALSQELARRKIDAALTSDRRDLAEAAAMLIRKEADRLHLGVRISGLDIRELSPPSQVLPAFEDVVNARQYAKTMHENSRQYRGETLAKSEGEAASIVHRAEGFAAGIVSDASGEASSFNAMLATYRRAPALVSHRLLRETLDTVMGQIHSRTLIPVDQSKPSLILEPSPEQAR